jgi:hypothetical protein
MNTKQNLILALTLSLLAASSLTTQAAIPLTASATFTSVPSGSAFKYTIDLFNTSAAGGPSIGSFWFGWTFSGDFLPNSPTAEAGPLAWSATVVPENSKFSIQYVLQSPSPGVPIAPGGFATFTFTSPDSPAVLTGNSVTPSGPVASSFVFSGVIFAGSSANFAVTEAPEPASLALFALGGLGLAALARRRKM